MSHHQKHLGSSRRIFLSSVGLLPFSFCGSGGLLVPNNEKRQMKVCRSDNVRVGVAVAVVQTTVRTGCEYVNATIRSLELQSNYPELIIFQPSRVLITIAETPYLQALAVKYQCYLVVGVEEYTATTNIVNIAIFGPNGYFIFSSARDPALRLVTKAGELFLLTSNTSENKLDLLTTDIVIDFRTSINLQSPSTVLKHYDTAPFLIRMPPEVNLEGACIFDNTGNVLTEVGADWDHILTADLDFRQLLRCRGGAFQAVV